MIEEDDQLIYIQSQRKGIYLDQADEPASLSSINM